MLLINIETLVVLNKIVVLFVKYLVLEDVDLFEVLLLREIQFGADSRVRLVVVIVCLIRSGHVVLLLDL